MMLAAHLPSYALADGDEAPFADGRLVHLPLDAWRRLDDSYPFRDFRYERSRPLFYVVDHDASAVFGAGDVAAFAAGPATIAHVALILRGTTYDRTLPPQLSVTYGELGGVVETVTGPLGRDAIIWGNVTSAVPGPLTTDQVRVASALFSGLANSAEIAPIAVLRAALELTCRPEIGEKVALVTCIAALEHALMSTVRTGLRTSFGRRTAALLYVDHADVEREAEGLAALYRLRSDLVHGRVRPATLELLGVDAGAAIGAQGTRVLVGHALVNLLSLARARFDLDGVGDVLDAAFTDGAVHADLRAQIQRGASGG